MPTIVGAGKYYMRRWVETPAETAPGGAAHVQRRLLYGSELMQMVGWDAKWFKSLQGMAKYSPDANTLLCSFEGNAFSAFAITPVLIAAFCGFAAGEGANDQGVVSSQQSMASQATEILAGNTESDSESSPGKWG